MKFNKAKYEKWVDKSLDAWVQLVDPDPEIQPLTKRQIAKYAKQLNKADFEIGRMWEANLKWEKQNANPSEA